MTSVNTNDTIVPLFKNRSNANVVLEDGTLVAFANKMFYTQDQRLIERLSKAAQTGEFGIYIDPADKDIDLEAATPMERLRKQIRQELEAEMKAGTTVIAPSSSSAQAPASAGLATTVNSQPEQQSQLSPTESTEQSQAAPVAAPVASTVVKPAESQPAQKSPQLAALERLKGNNSGNQQS